MERTAKKIFTLVMASALLLIVVLAFDSTEASAEHKPLEKGQYFKAGTCTIPGEGFGPNGGYHLNDEGDTFSYNGEWYSGGQIDKDDHDGDQFYKYPITIAYPNKIKKYYYTGGGWGPTFYIDSPGSYYDHSQFVKAYVFYLITWTYHQYPMPIYLREEDKGVPWGVQVLDGDGTKGNPFKFGLLFSEPYGIEVYHPDHGKISFIPPNAEAGNTVTFNVRPDSGYNIKSVGYWYFEEDGHSVVSSIEPDEDGNCSFTMPNKDIKIDATFERKPGLAGISNSDGGMVLYDTFEEAVDNWTDGTTLTMFEGAKINAPIDITDNRTLDLNGYVLKADNNIFVVKDGGSLTVNDSAPEDKHLFHEDEKNYIGGHLLGSVDGSGYAVKGLVDVKKGSFTMNGGSLINQSESTLKWGVSGTTGAKIAINGGYVKANRAVIMDSDEDAFVFLGKARFDLDHKWPVLQEGIENNYSVITIKGGYYKQDIGSLSFADNSIAPGYQAESKEEQIDWEYSDYAYRVEDIRPPYTVSVRENIENGSVKVQQYAREGDTVKLTIKPDDHYQLKDLIVTDSEGFRLPIIDDTFTMPESAIIVNAAFELIQVNDIRINKARLNIKEGGSDSLDAQALPYDAVNRGISWTSRDEDVATVDENGNVEAVGLGNTWITATTENGVSADCPVLVYHEHKLTKVESTESTCAKEGNIDYWVCDQGEYACGKLFADENGENEIQESDTKIPVDADRHSDNTHTDVHILSERTCTTPLRRLITVYCLDCNKIISQSTSGEAALGHAWGEWEVTKEATETEDGEMQRICHAGEAFAHTETRIIPAGNHEHNIVKVEAKAPTCTEEGNIEYWKCTTCEHCFADEEGSQEIPPEDVVIIQLGHRLGKAVEENVTPATCDFPKMYESVIYCEREGCGKEISRADKIEGSALGHHWSDWEEVDEDTHKRVCINDDRHTEVRTHRWDDGLRILPTCQTGGETLYTCRDCGATKVTNEVAPDPDAHVYENASYVWNNDNSKVTATHICKYDGTVEKEEAEVKVSETAPTCTADGVIVYKAVFTCGGFAAQSKEFPGEKALGHTWDSEEIIKKATVTADGEKEVRCSACGETKTETIAKAGTVIKGSTVKVSAKKLKKKAQTIKRTKAVSLSNAKGTVTYAKSTVSYKKAKSVKLSKKQLKKYKKSISKKFVVSKTTGKITAKKGLKKGTYKLKVTVKCAGDESYAPYTKKVTVTIKI